MAAMTDFLENKLIDWLFRAQAVGITGASAGAGSGPTALFVSLYTTMPNEAGGGGVEVSGTGYARVSVTSNTTNWDNTNQLNTTAVSTGATGTTRNSTPITFGAPTANWGTILGFGICDAVSAGNILMYGTLTASKTVNNGDAAPAFAINALSFQIDN